MVVVLDAEPHCDENNKIFIILENKRDEVCGSLHRFRLLKKSICGFEKGI